MTAQDRDRIHFFTRHFNDLQGLRYWVPLGLAALSGAACFASRALALFLFVGAVFLMLGARRYYRNTLGEVVRPPVAELCSLSVYSPAGPTPRLEGFQPVPPAVQGFLAAQGAALALVFALLVIIPVNTSLEKAEVQASLDAISKLAPWTPGITSIGVPASFPPMDLFSTQMIYVLFGTLLLYLWLWRERHASQSHHLALAVLLLGFAASGFFLHDDHWTVDTASNFLLPAVVEPRVALLLSGFAMILAGLRDHQQLVRALNHCFRGEPR
jgi:hypothetical protein